MAVRPFEMSDLGWIWTARHVDDNGPLRVLFVLAAIRVWPRIPNAIKRDNLLVTWVILRAAFMAVFAWSIVVRRGATALMPGDPAWGFAL
jgi:hypothetical protein